MMNPSTVDILLGQVTANLDGKVAKKLADVQRRHDELSSQLAEVRMRLESERRIFNEMRESFHKIESEELEAASRAISDVSLKIEDVRAGKKSLLDFFRIGKTPEMIKAEAQTNISKRMEELENWLREKSLVIARIEFEGATIQRDLAALCLSPVEARLSVLREMIDEVRLTASAQGIHTQNQEAEAVFRRAKDELRLAEGLLPQGHSFQVKSMKELLELRFHPGLREEARQRLQEIIAYMKKKKTFCRIFLVLDPYGQSIRRWWIRDEEVINPVFLPPRPDEARRII